MKSITVHELEILAKEHEGWCVSIYFSTIEKGQQTRQNIIRFRNMLDQAEEMLVQAGLRKTEAQDFLNKSRGLVQDNSFWQYQDQGLAVFINSEEVMTYLLPMEVNEIVIVNSRFYLKPLLPLLHRDNQFYILALSQNEVRFLKANEYKVEELEIPGLPNNMKEALGYDNLEKQLQWQTGTAPKPGQQGERGAMFHGHGEGKDKLDEYRLNFYRKVNKAVVNYLKDSQEPLVLAAVEESQPEYQKANTYNRLINEVVTGNPQGKSLEELQTKAWTRIKSLFDVEKEEIKDRYKQLSGRNDNLAVNNVEEIIKAAPYGRVEVLYVDYNATAWGTFDEKNAQVKIDHEFIPGRNHELLDFAAIQTLINGGTVFAVETEEVPESASPVAAIFRY